jgi:hypothetical protein
MFFYELHTLEILMRASLCWADLAGVPVLLVAGLAAVATFEGIFEVTKQ